MSKNNFKKILSLSLLVLFFAVSGFLLTNEVSAAWTDAPANPPGYGLASEFDYKPITQGGNDEYKTGVLGIKTSNFDEIGRASCRERV